MQGRHKHDRLSLERVRVSLAGGTGLRFQPLRRPRKENCKPKANLSCLGSATSKNKINLKGVERWLNSLSISCSCRICIQFPVSAQWLTIIHNSNFRGSDTFFWPPAPAHTWCIQGKYSYILNIKNRSF